MAGAIQLTLGTPMEETAAAKGNGSAEVVWIVKPFSQTQIVPYVDMLGLAVANETSSYYAALHAPGVLYASNLTAPVYSTRVYEADTRAQSNLDTAGDGFGDAFKRLLNKWAPAPRPAPRSEKAALTIAPQFCPRCATLNDWKRSPASPRAKLTPTMICCRAAGVHGSVSHSQKGSFRFLDGDDA